MLSRPMKTVRILKQGACRQDIGFHLRLQNSIPLHDIVGVRRRRGGISLAIRGYDRAIHFPDVPKTKRIEKLLNQQLSELASPIWR